MTIRSDSHYLKASNQAHDRESCTDREREYTISKQSFTRIFMKHRYLIIAWLMFGVLIFPGRMQTRAAAVTDLLGRRVNLPDDPRRVVSLAPNITEIIFALKQEHRLKGVTRYSDYPPAARQLFKVGSYVNLDLERIVSLKPDLCIAIRDGNPLAVIQRLESLNIPVYAVDPRNLGTVMETLLAIGKLLDARKTAETLVQGMRLRIEAVKSLVLGVRHRPRVFFQIGVSPIVSVGTDTFIHELIELAGGENLAKGPAPYPRFSQEQVLDLAPEVFIITSMMRAANFEQVKADWSRWSSMPAVRNQRIYLEDSNLFDRATPRLVDGLELLARLIHPDRFKETF